MTEGYQPEHFEDDFADGHGVRRLEAWLARDRATLGEWLGGPSATVALVFTDMVASTRHLYEHRSEHHMSVKRVQLARAKRLLDGVGARVVDAVGDSMFIVFHRTADAFQFSMRFFADSGPKDLAGGGATPVPVRIGIHHGRVSLDVTGLTGRAVHYAARVCQAGKGAELWVSDTAREELQRAGFGIAWLRSEAFELHGIPEPQRLWRAA